jgi:hypothetical protein
MIKDSERREEKQLASVVVYFLKLLPCNLSSERERGGKMQPVRTQEKMVVVG